MLRRTVPARPDYGLGPRCTIPAVDNLVFGSVGVIIFRAVGREIDIDAYEKEMEIGGTT